MESVNTNWYGLQHIPANSFVSIFSVYSLVQCITDIAVQLASFNYKITVIIYSQMFIAFMIYANRHWYPVLAGSPFPGSTVLKVRNSRDSRVRVRTPNPMDPENSGPWECQILTQAFTVMVMLLLLIFNTTKTHRVTSQ